MKRTIQKDLIWGLVVLVVAFAVRLVYLTQMQDSLLFDTPIMDSEYHDQWAQAIVAGGDFTGGVFFRAPLYPYFLALVYRTFGHDLLILRLIQFLIGSLSCVLVYLLGKRIFNRLTAVIAGVTAGLYGVLIYFEGELLIPVLLVFLDLIWILALLWTDRRPSYARWGLCGVLLGLSALARPNILLVGAAILVWMIIVFRRRAEKLRSSAVLYAICFALGAMLIISPVTVRNYIKGHDLVLIASQGGMNFYIGNNPQSDGASAVLPGARTTWWGSYLDAKEMAEKSTGRNLKPSEVSRFWYLQGLKFATGEPLRFLYLTVKKFILFWNGNELSNNRDFYFFARSAPILKLLIWRFILYFPFGLIAPLAIVGIILAHRERKKVAILEIFLLFYMLSIIFFFVTARYRVPLIPIFVLFSAFAVDRSILLIRQKRLLELGKYAAIFLAVCIPINLKLPGYSEANPGQAHYALGVVYAGKGDVARAAEEYRRALSYDPGLSQAYVNLGSIHGDQGEHELALEYYRMALENGADSAFVIYNIGIEYHNQGQLDLAGKNYELSLSMRDDNPGAHYLLGEIYRRKEMLEDAIREYQSTIRWDSSHAMSFYRLGMIYRQLGDDQRAIDNLEEFLRLWPGEPTQKEKVVRLIDELRQRTGR